VSNRQSVTECSLFRSRSLALCFSLSVYPHCVLRSDVFQIVDRSRSRLPSESSTLFSDHDGVAIVCVLGIRQSVTSCSASSLSRSSCHVHAAMSRSSTSSSSSSTDQARQPSRSYFSTISRKLYTGSPVQVAYIVGDPIYQRCPDRVDRRVGSGRVESSTNLFFVC